MKLKYFRWFFLAAIFLVISVGLILNVNLGTLSSLGWQAIATICPLGVIESSLAAKTIFPRALIVLVAVAVFVILFGKLFCAWVCPVAPLQSLRAIVSRKFGRPRGSGGGSAGGSTTCNSHCSSCTSKRTKLDSRHLVLGGALLSSVIFGFPVFCLVCPIGLIFGTVIVAWQFIGFDNLSLSLLIYPLLLAIELLVLRKWCAKFCPLGALLSLLSLPNRFFKPVVNPQKCIRNTGGTCRVCADVCAEQIDPHYACGMQECSKCGLCKDKCPAGAISFALLPGRDVYR